MRLLNVHDYRFRDFHGDNTEPYVITSHRWSNDEATYKDVRKQRNTASVGWAKIKGFCEQVRHTNDILQNLNDSTVSDWLWIDTACIDTTSAAEVQESINSMFRWYHDSIECHAYLADVLPFSATRGRVEVLGDFAESEWFQRGWTLQELLAPRTVIFFTQNWEVIGHKCSQCDTTSSCRGAGPLLNAEIAQITGIPEIVLQDFEKSRALSVEEKIKWQQGRRTTKLEDQAYCLLGIFDVYMPLIYGEGLRAVYRLERTILEEAQRPWKSLLSFNIADALSASFSTMSESRRFQRPLAITPFSYGTGEVACICNFDEYGTMITCDLCDKWQHVICYYPFAETSDLPDNIYHRCIACHPRQIDKDGARQRQQARRQRSRGVDMNTQHISDSAEDLTQCSPARLPVSVSEVAQDAMPTQHRECSCTGGHAAGPLKVKASVGYASGIYSVQSGADQLLSYDTELRHLGSQYKRRRLLDRRSRTTITSAPQVAVPPSNKQSLKRKRDEIVEFSSTSSRDVDTAAHEASDIARLTSRESSPNFNLTDYDLGYDFEVNANDSYLPVADVARVMKAALPDDAKVAKDGQKLMQTCGTELIKYMTRAAVARSKLDQRKAIIGEDVLYAFGTHDFPRYESFLRTYISGFMVQTSKNLDAGSAAESPHAKPAASALEPQETYVGAGEDPDVADGRAAKIQKLTHVPDSHNHPLLREADGFSHPMAAHKMAELDRQEESSAQNKQTGQLDWTVDLSFPDHFSFEDHSYRGTPNNATTLDGHELHHLWGETGFADPGGLYTVDHLNDSLTPLWNIGQAREHNPPEPLVFDQLAQQVGEQPADMCLTNSLVADHQLWPADATLINAQTSAHTGAYQGGVAAYRNVGIQSARSAPVNLGMSHQQSRAPSRSLQFSSSTTAPHPLLSYSRERGFRTRSAPMPTRNVQVCPVNTCQYHRTGFSRAKDLRRHMESHYPVLSACPFCSANDSRDPRLLRFKKLKEHLATTHGAQERDPKSARTSTVPDTSSDSAISHVRYRCSGCHSTFAGPQAFYDHMDECILQKTRLNLSQEQATFPCSICSSNFGFPKDLRRHITQAHSSDAILTMIDCEEPGCQRKGEHGFIRKDKYRDHIRQAHGKESALRGRSDADGSVSGKASSTRREILTWP